MTFEKNQRSIKKYYHLRVFGCQMNKSDAERIEALMQKAGYSPTLDENQADVIIAVACSVRQSPVDRIYGLSGRWRKLRATKILTGCVLEFDRGKMAERFDYIIPTEEIWRLAKVMRHEALGKMEENSIINYQLSVIKNDKIKCDYLSIPPKRQSTHQAYVPIMTGCDNYCSYCVVPHVRGKEVSRPADEIMKEVRGLVKQGYKEITLLGENVNGYPNFPALLKNLAKIPGRFWIRFVTSHPGDFTDELIQTIANEPKICNYIHLPLQSGNNTILKKMNRKYTKEKYVKLAVKIRKAMPDASLSTDIIVGFPGENKTQFEDTAKIMRKLKFDMAYIAQYSPRSGTTAAQLQDNVSRQEKKQREKMLTGILEKTAIENNQRLVEKIMEVLVEGENNKKLENLEIKKLRKANGQLMGKTENFKNVKFAGPKDLIGEFVKVKITKAGSWGLEGELINNN